jgi:hypothetical protein
MLPFRGIFDHHSRGVRQTGKRDFFLHADHISGRIKGDFPIVSMHRCETADRRTLALLLDCALNEPEGDRSF